MITNLYFICLILSIAIFIIIASKEFVNTDRYTWTILAILPVVILGYWLKSFVHSGEAAMITLCIIYLESTIMQVVIVFALLNSLNIKVNSWIKISAYTLTTLHLLSIWGSKDTHLYYASMELNETSLGTITRMTAGPLKLTHFIFLGVILISIICTIIVGFMKKGTFSKRVFYLYSSVTILGIVQYAIEFTLDVSFSMLPVLYVLSDLLILFNYEQFNGHDLRKLIDSKVSDNSRYGYLAFDMKKRFIGYTKPALRYAECIKDFIVDAPISKDYQDIADGLYSIIDDFEKSDVASSKIEKDGNIFLIGVSYFHLGNSDKKRGYLIEIVDITKESKQLELIENYNKSLGEAVEQKTAQVVDIQNKVVLGLADMVENRDDSTGGHIKRTSLVIQFMLNEALKQGFEGLDKTMAKNIMRAAPMHDLGKMTIDTSILCKPGKLTDEEYAIMKTHSAKSGEIVKIILGGVEEEDFVDIAYNVARYHHERWDGKGYPEGLLGERIPLEARFLAVVDVYDALVSKRCYKEAMSFEEAYKIMMENMGSHFDPSMRPIFVACRPQMEEYYSQQA